jgi:hypothetical protein
MAAQNLQDAQQRWMNRTAQAGIKWQQGVSAAGPGAYCEGLAKFGINPGACMSGPGAAWQSGVSQVGAAGFQQSIAGKGDKWARNWIRGESGGAGAY